MVMARLVQESFQYSVASKEKIAQNVWYLYLRMFGILIISLYSTRILLNNLGTVDYGTYSVIGGIVSLFSFFSTSLMISSQRLLAFELGKSDPIEFNQVFSAIIFFLILLSLISVCVLELVFRHFVVELNISTDRMPAAVSVFHLSVILFAVNCMKIPFSAYLVAKEYMRSYALMSVLDALIKLLAATFIIFVSYDKLISYACFLCGGNFIVLVIYIIVVFHDNIHITLSIKKGNCKNIVYFSGWNSFAGFASVGLYQGTNILLNLFWGPILNTTRDIALQVNSAVDSFATNIRVAINSQVYKSAAQYNLEAVASLTSMSIRLSAFMIGVIAIPLIFNMQYLLSLWLVSVPEFAVFFCQLILINCMIDVVSSPLVTIIQASGKIAFFQIMNGITILLIVPLTYWAFKNGYSASSWLIIYIGISILVLFERFVFVVKILGVYSMNIKKAIVKGLVLPVVTLLLYVLKIMPIFYSFVDVLIFTLLILLVILLISMIFLFSSTECASLVRIVYNRFIKKQ